MLAHFRDSRRIFLAGLAALVAACLLPSPLAAAALGAAAWLAMWIARAAWPRGERRRTLLLATLVATTLVAAGIDRAARRAPGQAAGDLARSQQALWQELERYAADAVKRLAAVDPGAGQGERFDSLRATAATDADARLNLLLWDRFGDLEAWWGPGLLPDLQPAARVDGEHGVEQSVLAATLHVTRRFRDAAGRPWILVAAESFPRDGPPPVAHGERERWRGGTWSLTPASGGAGGWVMSVTEPPGRSNGASPWRLAATVVAGLLLLALAASRGLAAGERDSPPGVPAAMWFFAAPGAAFVALGGGAGPAAAGAVAIALVTLGGGLEMARSAVPRPASLRATAIALAAGAGPALVLVAWRGPLVGDLVGGLDLNSASAAAWRLTIAVVLFAFWLAASAFGRGAAGERTRLRFADIWPAAAAAAAVLLVDYPAPACAALALAGGGAVAGAARRPRARAVERLGLFLLASIVAAAAWSAGSRLAERAALAAALPAYLPPSQEQVVAFASDVERRLGEVDPSTLLPAGAALAVPEDLAYALWRSSPLARTDVLSALVVSAPDGERSIFSSGLPIDDAGRLDLSPTRWIDLAPSAWIERRSGGESVRRDARGRPWLVRWLAVPLPGFGTADADAGIDGEARVVLYDARQRVARSPWAEGTPPLTEALAEAPAFERVLATPDGPAFAAARRAPGVTALLLVPRADPWRALERAGSFVAGAWVPWSAVALAIGLLVLPWPAIAGEARLLWRSYSRRLVLVFTLLLLVPLAVGSTWVTHAYARRLERQQEMAALDALHSAQRILGEYVLSLDPGFGVGTAVDDRLLEWLARVVSSEVNLYWGSELYASSKRDLFAAGLRPLRLSGEIWERIHLHGERVARRNVAGAGGESVEIYAPLEIPGLAREATKLVLALPRSAQQGELAAEIAAVRRRAFLAACALALLLAGSGTALARRFARPIEEIVRGTRRIADGAATLGYAPDEVELEALTQAIDRMATRVAEARERLLVEKGLVERIAENVTAAVVGLDSSGGVVFANRMARERLHASPGEPLLASLRAAGVDSVADVLEHAAPGEEPRSTRVDLGAGERDWTLVRAPLPGPGEPSELVVVEDVTDVVRAQRLDAWAGMARIIAHEIKNPLTPIRLSTEHLREVWARDREHFAEAMERCTANILRQVEELRRTASEFSLYSEIPRIERREDDLREAIGEVVEAYRAAPPAGVQVVFDADGAPLRANFDRRLLGRAVRNLVENALRASAGHGRVEIALAGRAGEVEVRVSDDGPGVPPELISRVLEPYFSTQSGGTGLGLPIARRVAEEHGGALSLRNLPSGGLEVTITIPRG